MQKILFVCTGNICRSPLAEGIFLDYVASNNLQDQFVVDSAGTTKYHVGEFADPRTIAIATRHSIDIKHIARQITKHDLEYYDFILVMDHRNYEDVLSFANGCNVRAQVLLLRSFNVDTTVSPLEYTVPDPYYGQDSDFYETYIICKRSIEEFINYLKKEKLI